jgi:YARHG domain
VLLLGILIANTRLLTMDDAIGMSIEEMRYAINEVYARYGATFPNAPEIQRDFQKLEWYHPNPNLTFDEVDRSMSDTEKQNVKFLAQCRELKRSK